MSNNVRMRQGLKVSDLIALRHADPDMQFLIAYRGRSYRISLGDMLSLVEKPTAEDIGLGLVDNTPDLDKPISVATAFALDNKADKIHGHSIDGISQLRETLAGKANKEHSHSSDEIENFNSIMATKANVEDIVRLDSKIDNGRLDLEQQINTKAPSSHSHDEFPLLQQAIDYLSNTKAEYNHTHSEFVLISEILNRKSDTGHTHEEFTEFVSLINALNENKANKIHNHNIDNINGLVDILATKATLEELYLKANIEHRHAIPDIDGLEDAISTLALKVHNHNIENINGLADILNSKLSIDTFNRLWNELPDFVEMNNRIDSKLDTSVFEQFVMDINQQLSDLVTHAELDQRLSGLELTVGNVRFIGGDW